jgi:hypothetical protein
MLQEPPREKAPNQAVRIAIVLLVLCVGTIIFVFLGSNPPQPITTTHAPQYGQSPIDGADRPKNAVSFAAEVRTIQQRRWNASRPGMIRYSHCLFGLLFIYYLFIIIYYLFIYICFVRCLLFALDTSVTFFSRSRR